MTQQGYPPGFPGYPAPAPQQAPQGYPQPMPGYPPQGYPQQAPAPQGYPQQPGYPPQGYPAPQPVPGYPQPAYPQQAAPQQQPAAPVGDWTALIGEAVLGNRGGENFIGLDGHAVIDVECVKVIQSIDHGPMLWVEFHVVEAAMVDSKTGQPEIMQPGEARSWGCKLQTKAGAADALEWHHHVLRYKLREQFNPNMPLTREVLLYGTSEQQPYKGIRFHLKTRTGPQKKDKTKDFTWHEWRVLGMAAEGHRLNLAPAQAQAPTAAPALPPMPPVAPAGMQPMPPAQPPTVPGGNAYAPPGMPGAAMPAPQPMPQPGYPPMGYPQQAPQGYPPQQQQPMPAPQGYPQQPAPGFGAAPPPNWPAGMPWTGPQGPGGQF